MRSPFVVSSLGRGGTGSSNVVPYSGSTFARSVQNPFEAFASRLSHFCAVHPVREYLGKICLLSSRVEENVAEWRRFCLSGDTLKALKRGSEAYSSVMATRKPASRSRRSMGFQTRIAERSCLGALIHEPLRKTRLLQSPSPVHGLPSLGAPR